MNQILFSSLAILIITLLPADLKGHCPLVERINGGVSGPSWILTKRVLVIGLDLKPPLDAILLDLVNQKIDGLFSIKIENLSKKLSGL